MRAISHLSGSFQAVSLSVAECHYQLSVVVVVDATAGYRTGVCYRDRSKELRPRVD
jgi:hypothetical protein